MGVREELQAVWEPKPEGLGRIVRGLLWREWLEHGRLFTGHVSIWLLGTWVLLLFFHPVFLLAFGVAYAFLVGTALGGADAAEGSEEFAFSLPPTRNQRYLVRLVLGAGTLVLLLALGLLAIGFDLPQKIWGLVVDSGFTEPFPECRPGFLYPLSFAVPVAIFSLTFVVASLAGSRRQVSSSWFLGALGAAAVMGAGFLVEHALWNELTGYISCPALVALAIGAICFGHAAYARKEGISRPDPTHEASRRWLMWILIAVLAGIILMVFLPRGLPPKAPMPPELREEK